MPQPVPRVAGGGDQLEACAKRATRPASGRRLRLAAGRQAEGGRVYPG